MQGRIQRLKKGGAHIEWGCYGHAARAARGIFALRAYNAQGSRRVWVHAPLGKFLSLDHNASEAVGDHHNHAKCLTTGL